MAQTIRYVKQGGTGDGSSWTNAADDLQLMINHSAANDQVWVAAGIYKPNRRADDLGTTNGSRIYYSFVLKADVKIYGGFAGTEATLSQRNLAITASKSTLSGDFNGDDASGIIATNSLVSGKNSTADHNLDASGYTTSQIFTNPGSDYTLKAGSPAINTGNNSFVSQKRDLAGNARIRNNTVDIDAYEVQMAIQFPVPYNPDVFTQFL